MDAMTEHVEVEVKLEADLEVELPDLGEVVRTGTRRTHELTAVYVDTPSRDLHRRGITLRRRTGGTDAGWHLKLPREDGARTEKHAPLGGSATRVPTDVRALVADVVERRPLLPVVTLRTRRVEQALCDGGDDVVRAVLADDLVVAEPPGAGWREVEVELTDDGDEAFLERVVDLLVGSGWQRSTSPSKYSRAVGLLPRPEGQDLTPGSPAADVVLAYLHEQIGMIQARESELREHDPDAVHKTRVATRRLRTTLRVFRRLLHRAQIDPLRDELRWYAHHLGEVRDLDVVRAHLVASTEDVPEQERDAARARIEAMLGEAHAEATARLDEVLDSQRLADLLDALAALGTDPPWRGRARRRAKKVLPDLLDAAVRRVEKRARAARSTQDPQQRRALLHETRKKAKAARYAYEAWALARGAPAAKAAERWEQVTDTLGLTQDGVTVRSWLEEIIEAARTHGQGTTALEQIGVEVDRQGESATRAGERALRAASDRGT